MTMKSIEYDCVSELVLYGIEKFSYQELLMFRAACQKMARVGEDVVLFSFEEVQQFFNVKNIEDCDVAEELHERCGNLLNPIFKYSKHSEHFVSFCLFESVCTNRKERTVSIRATKLFVKLMAAFENEKGISEGPRVFLGTRLPRGKLRQSEYSFGLDVLIGQTNNPRLF